MTTLPRLKISQAGLAARLVMLVVITAALVGFTASSSTLTAMAAPPQDEGTPGTPNPGDLDTLIPSDPNAVLPGATCSLNAVTNTRTCDLWAKPGTLALPGGVTVPIWGFALTQGELAQVPGPYLGGLQNENMVIVLHNRLLTETLSLSFPGIDMPPDASGVAAGGDVTYTFKLSSPGTFSYEAGLTPNGNRQVAMGLFGILAVRPATGGSLYGDAASSITDSAMVILSEVDPQFNNDPLGFSLENYHPTYFLINGKAYPDTSSIVINGYTSGGSSRKLGIRYLNAGLQPRTVSLLGFDQLKLGANGSKLPFYTPFTAETIAPGQTMDAIFTLPSSGYTGAKIPLYETGFKLHNNGTLAGNGQVDMGGAMVLVEIAGGNPLPNSGPKATAFTAAPSIATATTPVTLNATFATGNVNTITEWEYFINTTGAPGTGNSFVIGSPAPTVNVNDTVQPAVLSTLPIGDVSFYARAKDSTGTWGPLSSVVIDLVKAGPAVRGLELDPNPTNGSRDVTLRGTADTSATGNQNVTGAEYFIDMLGTDGTGTAVPTNGPGTIVALEYTIPQAAVNALAEGKHTIYVHAKDALDQWGAFTAVALQIDRTGPTATGQSLGPNPNNGTLPINTFSNGVRLVANFNDPLQPVIPSSNSVHSNIAKAEGFIDYQGPIQNPDGTGFPLMAVDALFNNTSENGFVDIPLPTIKALSDGTHLVSFHGQDAAGNWGPMGTMSIIIDKTGPALTFVSAVPQPSNGNSTVTVLFNAADPNPASGIAAAEWFRGSDPGPGNGNPMTAYDGAFGSQNEVVQAVLPVGGWLNGNYSLYFRAKDLAGNWTPVAVRRTIAVTNNNLLFVKNENFEAATLAGWSSVRGRVSVDKAAAMDGEVGLKAVLDGTIPAYVIDESPNGETGYQASFLFNPNDADTAGNAVDIFMGENASGQGIFGLQFETGDVRAEVRAWALTASGPVYTQWYEVANAPQKISISWQSGVEASLKLSINDAVLEAADKLDTSANLVETVKLGPSGNLQDGFNGSQYYDAFTSTRSLHFVTYLPAILRK